MRCTYSSTSTSSTTSTSAPLNGCSLSIYFPRI